ncbi:kinase-like domain-containing protein [Trichophaea hybrida]|nr:kinase-like domain-containing protein [Trichophaea hybrida]
MSYSPSRQMRHPTKDDLADEYYMSYKLTYDPDWRAEAEIGRGGYGIVFSAQIRRPGMLIYELCAVKKISKSKHLFPRKLFEAEISTFARLSKHEWFVQFFGWHEDDMYTYIAMEFMGLGNLEQHIHFKWSERDTKVVATQLLEGLRIMHRERIIHHDLKPANLFPVFLDHKVLRIKIGDFGVSKRIYGDTQAETKVGSLKYMAPEVLNPSASQTFYSDAVDLWAFGCILYRMMTGEMPFSTPDDISRYKHGLTDFPRTGLEIAGVSDTGIRYIESLIHADPETRATLQEASEGDWIIAQPLGFEVTEELVNYFKIWSPQPNDPKCVTPHNKRISVPFLDQSQNYFGSFDGVVSNLNRIFQYGSG